MRDADQRGLLWLLDEDALYPGATEESFLERLFLHHGEEEDKRKLLHTSAANVTLVNAPFALSHVSRIYQPAACF